MSVREVCAAATRHLAARRGGSHNRGMDQIEKVGVVGAGTMGNGIAQVFAQSGYEVRLVDAMQSALDRARATIDKSLAKLVESGVEIIQEPTDRFYGTDCAIRDPFGNHIRITQEVPDEDFEPPR